MDNNLAPDPLQVHRLILLTVQPHQTRNILLPGLVLAYAYFLLPVPLQAPFRDPLLILPVPIHVQARDIPLTRLDIPPHPLDIHLQAKVIAKLHPNIPQIPPDIHLQARVTVQLPLAIQLQARVTIQLPLNMRLQARITVQFLALTPLLPLNIHLQARLTVQSYPLTLQLPLQVPVLVQPGPMNLNWIHPLNLKMHQLYGILLSDSTSESYYFKSTVFLTALYF